MTTRQPTRESTSHRTLAALALGIVALAGCPGPTEPSGPCGAVEGEPVLTLFNRGGGTELADGVEVEVFPPPQGGVFTELDVTIEGLALDELDTLRIAIATPERSFANVTYQGDFIPLMCTEDELLVLQYMPVGFIDPVVLEELDGVAATLTGTLVTARGDFTVAHDVVLRVTDY